MTFPGGEMTGVLVLALLLGARHAVDPDHVAAVSQIVLGDSEGGAARSGWVGLCWGLGHAATLSLLGLPVVLWGRALPEVVHRAAEVVVGVLLVVLAVRLLLRCREGWAKRPAAAHPHAAPAAPGRSPVTAFAIGLVHGVGGSAGVGVLAVGSTTGAAALGTLLLFSATTAASMGGTALALGWVVTREPVLARLPRVLAAAAALGALFGLWYTASVLARGWPG